MAVILRNGASRTSTPQTHEILRSSTINIAKTGLITSMTSGGKTVSVLNLGYLGEHNVTRLWVNTWDTNAGTFTSIYEPVLIFIQGARKLTLAMSNEENKFYVDLPRSLTTVGGNYQIYFALKEKISSSISNNSAAIGSEDDPAYREVFISDVCKGAVDTNSGYSILPNNFDWSTGLYNYYKGFVSCLSSSWTESTINDNAETGVYVSTGIYLGGLQDGKTATDIIPHSPDESLLVISDKTLSGKTLTITATFQKTLTDDEELALLEQIVIEYPVNFSVAESLSGYALKSDIKVVYDPFSISVDKNFNTILGMKMDAYVTPINLSGLYNFPLNTKKYVVFSKDKESLVCEAFNDTCWIPTQVTGTAGNWKVSFIVKGNSANGLADYEYHTGIITLPVIDNTISKADLVTGTAYRAVLDSDAKALYDVNSYALYSISDSTQKVNLSHSAEVIDRVIGWASGIYPNANAERIVTAVSNFETVSNNYTQLRADLTTANMNISTNTNNLNSEIARATAAEATLQSSIDTINETIETLDVTILKDTVESHSESIEAHDGRLDVLEADMSSAKNSINDYTVFKGTYSQLVSNLQAADTKHDEEISDLKTKNSNQDGRLTIIEDNIELMTGTLEAHGGRLDSIQSNLNSESALINEMVRTERAERIEEDRKLEDAIEAEEDRAKEKENELTNALQQEIETRTNVDETLQDQIDDLVEKDRNLQGQIDDLKQVDLDLKGVDATLQKNIDDEQQERINSDEELQKQIGDEVFRAENAEQGLASSIDTVDKNLDAVQKDLQGKIDALEQTQSNHYNHFDGEITAINTSNQIVRNDFMGVAVKPYVARIVLIQHMLIQDVATLANVPYETTEQQEAFKAELIEAGIITIDSDLTQPLLAEQVIEILRLKEATETNTLYLVQEEE